MILVPLVELNQSIAKIAIWVMMWRWQDSYISDGLRSCTTISCELLLSRWQIHHLGNPQHIFCLRGEAWSKSKILDIIYKWLHVLSLSHLINNMWLINIWKTFLPFAKGLIDQQQRGCHFSQHLAYHGMGLTVKAYDFPMNVRLYQLEVVWSECNGTLR